MCMAFRQSQTPNVMQPDMAASSAPNKRGFAKLIRPAIAGTILAVGMTASACSAPATQTKDSATIITTPNPCADVPSIKINTFQISPPPSPAGFQALGNKAVQGAAPVLTNNIVGYANITSMCVSDEYSGLTLLHNDHNSSLQLNTVLFIQSGSTRYFYWVQNVAEFDTKAQTVNFSENIWALGTADYFNLNTGTLNDVGAGATPPIVSSYQLSNIIGFGTVAPSNAPFNTGTGNVNFYGLGTENYSLQFPAKIALVDSVLPNGNLSVGYSINGQPPTPYDDVTITIPHTNMQFINSGTDESNSYAQGNASSALVFAGSENGYDAAFTSMNAEISLYYSNQDGLYMPFTSISPSDSIYGTGEGVFNIKSAVAFDGTVKVSIGSGSSDFQQYGVNPPAFSTVEPHFSMKYMGKTIL